MPDLVGSCVSAAEELLLLFLGGNSGLEANEAALKLAHGNVSQAARLLGIHRTTLYNRMEATAREP